MKGNKKTKASETIIEVSGDNVVVRQESLLEKASKLISTKSKKELAEYAEKYSIEIDQIAQFLAEKKPASLQADKFW